MAKGGNRLRSYEIMHEIYYPIMHRALGCYALLYILNIVVRLVEPGMPLQTDAKHLVFMQIGDK
jgi:hypothetical protein